jgi:hypothetical protein
VGVADWVACGYMAKADGCKRCWQLQPWTCSLLDLWVPDQSFSNQFLHRFV